MTNFFKVCCLKIESKFKTLYFKIAQKVSSFISEENKCLNFRAKIHLFRYARNVVKCLSDFQTILNEPES